MWRFYQHQDSNGMFEQGNLKESLEYNDQDKKNSELDDDSKE
jgi:hypothetical protein